MADPPQEYLVTKYINMDEPRPYIEPSLEPEVTTLKRDQVLSVAPNMGCT